MVRVFIADFGCVVINQRFGDSATGINTLGVLEKVNKHCASISFVLRVYKAVIQDGGFVSGCRGPFIWQNWPFLCRQESKFCCEISTALVSS